MVLACGTTEEKPLSNRRTQQQQGEVGTTRQRVAQAFELAEPECIQVWGQVQLIHPMMACHPLHVSHRPLLFAPGNIVTNHLDCNIMLCALRIGTSTGVKLAGFRERQAAGPP